MEEKEKDQTEKKLISQPLTTGTVHVKLSEDRLSRIRNINSNLDSIKKKNFAKMKDVRNRISQNKAYIEDTKQKIPPDTELKELKKEKQIQDKYLNEINKLTKKINTSIESTARYNQTNAFLSILIEKALNSYYPSVKRGENIHENLIQSVEEDENFNYGKEIIDQISKH